MMTHMDPRDLRPGQMVDCFRIIRCLGSGSFGVVFEAEKQGHRFALKFACHREGSGDAAQTHARLERELICLLRLRHPNIVRLWGSGRWPDPRTGYLYLVLDLIDGFTLEQWVERTHPTAHEVAALFDKAFSALEHIHERGVVHRDLNLRNIMVSASNNEPIIIDFSVGDFATAEGLTNEPLPPGTRRYRSPEATRFWEEHRHDPLARYTFKPTDDIYALGALLYDVLTYTRPSEAHQGEAIDGALIPPLSPFEVTAGRVPEAFSDFTMNVIARAPEERPAHARDARRVLMDLQTHRGPAWHTPFQPAAAQVPTALVRAARRLGALMRAAPALWGFPGRRALLLGGGLALVALLAILGAASWHPQGESVAPAASPDAKQTSPSGGLPSTLPTQKELPSPLNPPEKVAPPPAPKRPPARKASAPRAPSLSEQCTLAIATAAWLNLGCAGVQLRPDPGGACSEEVIAVMHTLHWTIRTPLELMVDMTQRPVDFANEDALYKDGPVTGELYRAAGLAPAGTTLEGHLWTSGDRIYGHFLWANVPGTGRLPVCVELGLPDDGQVGATKREGSKPGAALSYKVVYAVPRKQWR